MEGYTKWAQDWIFRCKARHERHISTFENVVYEQSIVNWYDKLDKLW